MKEGWEKIANELNYDPKESVDFKFLVEQLPNFASRDLFEDESEILEILRQLFQEAAKDLLKMKKDEGQMLGEDILHRLAAIEQLLEQIAATFRGFHRSL